MPIRERILSMGITGSGKSYQWLKIAETLMPTGAIFRCIDTDASIDYMLATQFPHLKKENGGNVILYQGHEWMELREVQQQIFKEPIKDNDWLVIDMADEPWDSVQSYFTTEVFKANIGDYFLEVRKAIQESKKKTSSVAKEAFDGWKDWSVINKLYFDWFNPFIYRMKCHLYITTKVAKLLGDQDAELKELFGGYGIKPTGQKAIGHKAHTVLLFLPGKDKWFITTLKDRAGRKYFNRSPLSSLYVQYLVVKAGWPMIQGKE